MLASKGAGGADDAVAPMPGVIEKISVEPGAEVQKGDPLVTMIAMKMEVSRNFLAVNARVRVLVFNTTFNNISVMSL